MTRHFFALSGFPGRVWLPVAVFATLALPILSAPACTAQVTSQTQASAATVRLPAFQEAQVKLANPRQEKQKAGIFAMPGGGVRAERLTLGALMWYAFDVRQFQVTGGPAWIHEDQFDVVARPPAAMQSASFNEAEANSPFGSSPLSEEQRLMLQSLLVEHFHLRVHQETSTGPVYVLERSRKRPNLHSPRHGNAAPWVGSNVGTWINGDGIVGKNISMAMLAARLSRYMQCPVVDKTGLKGSFDFQASYADNNPNTDEALVNSIVKSVEEIGLKLSPSTGEVNMLVVDNAEEPSGDGLNLTAASNQ